MEIYKYTNVQSGYIEHSACEDRYQEERAAGLVSKESITVIDTEWLEQPAPVQPNITVDFEYVGEGVIGSQRVPVKRIENQDDGSFTVILDYWPAEQELQEKAIEIAQAFSRGHDAGWESATAHHKALAEQPAPAQYRSTGWAAHRDQYAVPVLFNPYTGEPRDVRDVQSDPQGILIVPPGKVEMLAAAPPAQRKPLTLREIGAVCGNFSNETIKVVRQTEAAHNIKEQP